MNLNDYVETVYQTMSGPSKHRHEMLDRIDELGAVNVPMLITAAMGLPAEAGEFTEIVKKVLFQGKELDEATIFHMKRELGDIGWYFSAACLAIGVSPEEIFRLNAEKLSARFPNGFEVSRSEVRSANDV